MDASMDFFMEKLAVDPMEVSMGHTTHCWRSWDCRTRRQSGCSHAADVEANAQARERLASKSWCCCHLQAQSLTSSSGIGDDGRSASRHGAHR